MPNLDKLCNDFRAAGTNGCLDFSLSLLATCDSVSWSLQNVARVQRIAINQGERRSLARSSAAGCLRELEGCPLEWTSASSDNAQSVIKNAVNQASMRAATPSWCTVLSSRVDQGQGSSTQCPDTSASS